MILAGLVLGAGCTSFDKVPPGDPGKAPDTCKTVAVRPCGPRPTTIAPIWQPSVLEAPDPVRGGAMNPALGGRVYLFGANDVPSYFEGTMTVIAYDVSACGPGLPAQPRFLYQWQFPPEVLRLFQKEDLIGKGYTIVCPFPPGVYDPGICRVQLQVAFEMPGGPGPLYSDACRVTLGSRINDFFSQTGPTIAQATTTSAKPK
jgi:hypothetical protein